MSFAVRTPHQLGTVLRGQRKALKLTQRQAAAPVGLLPKTVSRLEQDPSTAAIASLFKLLSALDLELVLRPKRDAPKGEW